MAVIGPVWYVALAAAFVPVDLAHRPILGFGWALTVAVLAVLSAATPPGALLPPVFVLSAVLVVRRAWRNRAHIRPAWTLKAAGVISGVAVIALVTGSAYAVLVRVRQEPADLVIMWPGTGPSRMWLNSMPKQVPPDLHGLRRVMCEHKGYEGGNAARHLGTVGSTDVDVPLILDCLEQNESLYAEKTYIYQHEAYTAALKSLTGLNLPLETTSTVWRQALAERSVHADTASTGTQTD